MVISIPAVIVATATAVVVFTLMLILGFVLYRKKAQGTGTQTESSDDNPVYGVYYFADDSRVDNGENAVTDSNDYYEAS